MTLGVRAVVCGGGGSTILLVRHTYVPGWHLPGGGVEAGETAIAALKRELAEETNVNVMGQPELVSTHFNRHASRRDHILLYRVPEFEQPQDKRPDMEIAEAGFFPLDALPHPVSRGTKRRIAELLGEAVPDGYW